MQLLLNLRAQKHVPDPVSQNLRTVRMSIVIFLFLWQSIFVGLFFTILRFYGLGKV